MKNIEIFYHLYMVNDWQAVFEWQLGQLRTSGLYKACSRMHLGLVYDDCRALSKLDTLLFGHDKIDVRFSRDLKDAPVIWSNPEVRLSDGRFGESETILHMVEYAQRRDRETRYLFFHSKGVTNPPTKRRRHLPYLVGRGFDPSGSNDDANAFVLKDTITVVSNWLEYVEALEEYSFWYYIYNFFWVSGDLLHQFDFHEYVRLHRDFAPMQQRRYGLDDEWNRMRHLFSHFPIKLYAFTKRIEMDQPAYTYINVRW